MGLDELFAASRTRGRVDEHDGEYVETEFTCLGWFRIPLVPVRSFWIADDQGRKRSGFPIKLHPRSVAAAYLRTWAPAAGVVTLAFGSSLLGTVIAACLFGLSAWSWTWWPRDAAVRRAADFDLATFGSRCDPGRMTDVMHQFLAGQLMLRTGSDPRSPEDIVRFGPRTMDEALLAYGLSRLRVAQAPPLSGLRAHLRGAAQTIGSVVRSRRPRGGPYRDRHMASSPELWTMLSTAARDAARGRRAGPLRSYPPVPAPGVVVRLAFRKPWLGLVVLAVSTIASAVALASTSSELPGPPVVIERRPSPPSAPPRRAGLEEPPLPAEPPDPRPPPAGLRRVSGDELARRPIGAHVAVSCDYVQSSDRGRLRHLTLCLIGSRILAVAGGNRRHDSGRLLHGYVEEISSSGWSWEWPLTRQLRADPRYYDFYLRRVSYGDDIPDDPPEPVDPWSNIPMSTRLDVSRPDVSRPDASRPDDRRVDAGRPGRAPGRGLAVAAAFATLAAWWVWLRLWLLRRRAARWIIAA